MAFSIRKIISNISYFSKSIEGENSENDPPRTAREARHHKNNPNILSTSENIEFTRVEPDSTSKSAQSLNLPASVKSYAAKKGSHSDTDVLAINIPVTPEKRKCRKLKLDVDKASENNSLDISDDSSLYTENTPKHKLLESKNTELLKGFNFNQSFEISDAKSDSSYDEHNDYVDIQCLTEHSDSDSGDNGDGTSIKMCRKVEEPPFPSPTPESFTDVEIDKNEEGRIALLLNYQTKIEKLECTLKKLLNDFQFHIEVSKVFNCKAIVTALPGTDMTSIPKTLGDIKYIDNIPRGDSPGWNIVTEKEDIEIKTKLKRQLTTIRNNIDTFIHHYLEDKRRLRHLQRSNTFNIHKGTHIHKQSKVNHKKKIKHYDFPDYRDAMVHLFCDSRLEDEKCNCSCHSTDLDTTIKSDKETNQSITSSIGNFSLDSTTITAYSESLDHIISYNSFQDTSLYSTILQKSAIERITFYIQVHSIQLKCEHDSETSKNIITFFCPPCNVKEFEENGLIKHILSQYHCEKIHFLYKAAYVKKCISNGKEIMPSTVLNPMTYYRDENKIVCFGDAVYACSLCFENLIVGESVLMAHCSEEEHVNRREMLEEAD